MIYLIILSAILLAITVWQRLKLINADYRMWIIEEIVDRMIVQLKREHSGAISYDLLLKRLDEIKINIKYGRITEQADNKISHGREKNHGTERP